MKVYIVQTCEYDDGEIHGVYASEAAANHERRALEYEARNRAMRTARRWAKRAGRDEDKAALQRVEEWRDHYAVFAWDVIQEAES